MQAQAQADGEEVGDTMVVRAGVEGASTSRGTLDGVAHREVRELRPGASPPRFTFAESEGARIVYGETTEVRHEVHRLDDAPDRTLRVTTRTG